MNTSSRPNRFLQHQLFLLVGLGLALAMQSVFAANVTWVGNTSNLWNTGTNWSTSAIPANGDTLVFGNSGSSGLAIVDDIATITVGGSGIDGIVFNSTSGSYAISKTGTTLTLGSSAGGIAIKDTSLFLETISSQLNYSGNQTVQVGNTTGAALSSLSLTGVQTGGSPRLTKTGTGLLTISSGTNALGGLTVNQGTVSIGADGQLSSTAPGSATAGWIALNGGTLRTNVNVPFALNANRGIALGDGTAGSGGTLNVYSTTGGGSNLLTLTYNGIIANNGGTNSLTKTGFQVLALGGPNTYTGATKINQGQLTLDFTQGTAPTSNIINSSSNLVMGDIPTSVGNASTLGAPILLVQGSNTATTSQTFNGTAINPGNASIMARGGTSTFNATLNLAALTHSSGGTVGFSTMTNTSTGKGVITTTTANTNGILGGWATSAAAVGTGTVPLTQTDWAANDGSGNIVAYTGYTIATSTLANNAANNVRIDGTSTGNISLTFASTVSDLNTIQVTDPLARTIVVGSGNTLRLGSFGGIWRTTTTNVALNIGASTAQGGTLTAGGAANTAGEIVFNSGAGAATTNNTIVVNSVIADNGTGVVSVVKTGAATVTLNAANTFTGGTIINQGGITANVAGAFGGAGHDVTVMPGGSIITAAGGGLTYANNFKLAGSALTLGGTYSGGATTVTGNTVSGTVTLLGDVTVGNSSTSGTISGKITGDYSLSAIGGLIVSNATNDFTGNFGVNGVGAALGNNPVTVKLGNSDVIPNGAGKGSVWISGGTAGVATLDLNGQSDTINGLNSASSVANARITNGNATASTLTLGDNDQTATYAGAIIDGTGKVAITKIGIGTQTLSGANSYTGATTVSAGTLAISGSPTLYASLTGSNVVTNGTGIISQTSTGVIGGNATVTQGSSGNSVLSGVNAYTGDTIVNAGTLSAGGSHAFSDANGIVTANTGGTVDLAGQTLTAGKTITLAGGSLINSTGTATLNTGASATLLTGAGTIFAPGAAPTITITGGSGSGAVIAPLQLANTTVSGLVGGAGYSSTATATFSTVPAGGVQATASIAFGLSQASITSVTGGTGWVTGDTVSINGGTTAATATVTASGGAITGLTLLTAGTGYTAAPTAVTKVTSTSGSATGVTITGTATNFVVSGVTVTNLGFGYATAPTLTISAPNGGGTQATITGPSSVLNSLYFNNGGTGYTSAPTVTISGGPTATGGFASINVTANSSIGGNGNLVIAPVISSTGNFGLTKVGSGTTTFSGANTYTGNTLVSAGVLALGNNLALQNSTLDTSGAGTITVTGFTTPTIGGLAGSGNLASVITTGYSAVTSLTLNPQTGITNTYSGVIADGAAGMTLTKSGAGTQVLSGTNLYTGATTVNGGTLTVNGSLASGSAVTVNATGTLNGTGSVGATAVSGGSVGGSLALASLTSTGTSSIVSGASLAIAGGTSVNSGTLFVNGTISSGAVTVASTATLGGSGSIGGATTIQTGGTVSPGNSPGNLTFTNGLTLNGAYKWELAALSTGNPGVDFDRITVTNGAIDLTGATMNLALGSFAPSADTFWGTNQTWTGIINNTGLGSITGTFAAIDNSSWSVYGTFATVINGTSVDLAWTAIPEPSTYAAIFGALALAGATLRRRKRS